MTTYVFDASDKRKLVGASGHVFVGRVLGRTVKRGTGGFDPGGASEPVPDSPRTQFEVAVTENTKGDLEGTVTVSQEGGYAEYAANKDYPEAGVKKGQRVRELMSFEGDPLLLPGQEVLLVANHDEQNGWLRIATLRERPAPAGRLGRTPTDHGGVRGGRAQPDQGLRFGQGEPAPPEDRPPPPSF